MSRFWVVNLIDRIFIMSAIFLIVFAWTNFYLRDLLISFVVSLVFTFSFSFILMYLTNKKNKKRNKIKNYINEVNTNYLAFHLSSLSDKIELMSKILSNKNEIISKKHKLIYNSNGLTHIMFFPSKTEINNNDLIEILSNENLNKIDVVDIICEKSNNVNKDLFSKIKINIITKETLYDDYFNQYKTYPDLSRINCNLTKMKFKDLFLSMFDPKHTKGYFFCGLVLIFSSFIIPFQPYYIVVGSMLLLFSLISKILPKFRK